MPAKTETIAVLRAIRERETAAGAVGVGNLIDATGLDPQVAVNELERLLRGHYVSGQLKKTLSGGDPRPWVLLSPLLTQRGSALLEQNEVSQLEPATDRQAAPNRVHHWDAFVSHASEDKAGFVAQLARELTGRGLKVWYDDDILEVGDSVRRAIDHGLRSSDFGIVVISADFMRKDWTNRELDGLLALGDGGRRLLPVWHKVDQAEVQGYSPIVAGLRAARSADGIAAVVTALCRAMKRGVGEDSHISSASPGSIVRSDLVTSADVDPGPQIPSRVRRGRFGLSREAWAGIGVTLVVAAATAGSAPWWWPHGSTVYRASPAVGMSGGCAPFQVFAQNRWAPVGTAIRAAPNVQSEIVGSFPANMTISVNGWVHGRPAYPTNTVPWNSDIWFHLTDGAGWVSFAGVRAVPVAYDPSGTSLDGGATAPVSQYCEGGIQ